MSNVTETPNTELSSSTSTANNPNEGSQYNGSQNSDEPIDTLFIKIINREIPADIVYEDELCLAFKDINPQAPTHLLLIPKKPIVKVSDSKPEDQQLLGHLLLKAGDIARQFGFEDGFRLAINNGAKAGQTVFHMHIHILAGRKFEWPPG